MFWQRGKQQIAELDDEPTRHARTLIASVEHDTSPRGTTAHADLDFPAPGTQADAAVTPSQPPAAQPPLDSTADNRATDAGARALDASEQEATSEIMVDEPEETYEVIVTYEQAGDPAVAQLRVKEPLVVPPDTSHSPSPDDAPVRPSADHDLLYARNWAFIDQNLQARLAGATLFTAGTGLGSLVATLAVRTGFTHFILADGDHVENTNLNRQAFERAQVGHNKAVSTAEQIRRIQSQADVEVIPRFVDESDFPALIARSDFIVNTIDFSSPAFLSLNRLARAASKTVLFPFNLGWGGALMVFTPDSATLDEFAGVDPHAAFSQDIVTRLILRVIESIPGGPPPYFLELMARYATRTPESWPYDPQLGVGTHITASLVVQAAVSLVAGWPVRIAPDVAWCDARAATSVNDPLGSVSP